ncbi:uncharacterized protein DFL_006719 [Arthrobotrys flagrans]|uniref:Uncharacterized protein n=1 Tax=Arthrobotrys flagrans TaxID=97331 RepID=A0A436ZTM6_ARTFL|nr:hypothetical protein DFL_006719 [Arthrobotrys flagrans]
MAALNCMHAQRKDTKGWVPLHYAAAQGCLDTIEILVSVATEAKIALNINQLDHQGRPPLYVAAESGQVETVKVLKKTYKADIEMRDSQTRLYSAVLYMKATRLLRKHLQ